MYDRGQDPNEPDWASVQMDVTWNDVSFPLGWDEPFLLERKRNLSKQAWEQSYLAKFVTRSGLVYSDFTYEEHVKKIPYNRAAQLYVSVDWGLRKPFVVFGQTRMTDKGPVVEIIDEVAGVDLTYEMLYNAIQKKITANGYNIAGWFCDPAGYASDASSGIGGVEYFRRKGINMRYRNDELSRNIQASVEHMKKFIKSADGSISFYVDDGCKGFLKSITSYVYPEPKAGKAPSEIPLKSGVEDACDACRYLLTNKFPLRGPGYKVGYSSIW